MITAAKNRLALPAALSLCVLSASLSAQGAGATYRVSIDSQARQADYRSLDPAVSGEGFVVAFTSRSTNLVPGDTNNWHDIFVNEILSGRTTRVSVDSSGAEADASSRNAAVSDDGRYVAFESDATNLVTGDNNGYTDIFVHDRNNGRTTRVSISSNGMEGTLPSLHPSISGDGRYVAFASMADNLVNNDGNGYMDVFVHDRLTRQTVRASVSTQGVEGDDDSYTPSISVDGRWVAFSSGATNLVAGDTNGRQDVMVHDLLQQQTHLVSVGAGGAQADGDSYSPDIGTDGSYVAFHSDATNLVPGDTNNLPDVFRVDRNTMTTDRVSVSSAGAQSDGNSRWTTMSNDGRYVGFQSAATTLTQRTSFADDIYVRDLQRGTTTLHSMSSEGYVAQDQNCCPAISGNGRYVAFSSLDDGMVPDDTNGYEDIMVNEVTHHLEASGPARIGQTTTLTLRSPRDSGKIYVALAAFNTEFGIRLGSRLFPLDMDALLRASTGAPSVFGNFIGLLDGNGQATATVTMPNLPALVNFELVVAYTVIDPSFPTAFLAMSNAQPFLVGQ